MEVCDSNAADSDLLNDQLRKPSVSLVNHTFRPFMHSGTINWRPLKRKVQSWQTFRRTFTMCVNQQIIIALP